ncbi:MAG: neutral/alkaline non-lysosomal ceramidase N-terminal domain-containing protein [Planctomycetaceae bacterium]|nr:neutral/alkaline non-lysosomal ceramidase N-terminal domain-containing protein [Planctomycetaceae bacterium]
MSFTRLFGMVCGGLIALSVASLALAQETTKPTTPYKVGVASVKITPTEMMWLTGYAGRTKPADDVEIDLFAKALAIEDQNGAQVVLVTTDLIGIPRRMREAIETSVREKYKLQPEALLLNASHTHCGPELLTSEINEYGLDAARVAQGRQYMARLKEQLVNLIGEAIEKKADANLIYSHARAGFAMNRRLPTKTGVENSPYPDGPVDQDVPVLQVKDKDGKLKAVLFGYACHNTTLGYQKFSGDYAGFAQQAIEELHPGVTALFLMGCGGDQNPYPRGEIALCRHHGRTLALAVETALQTKHFRVVTGPVRTGLEKVALQFVPAPPREELLKLKDSKDRYDRRRGEFLLNELETQGTINLEYPYTVQVMRLGDDITLVALAGETVVDYSLRLKKELKGSAEVWVAGYSNDVFGYVPSRRVLEEGGYEGVGAMRYTIHPGPFEPSVEERIITSVHRLVKQTTAHSK